MDTGLNIASTAQSVGLDAYGQLQNTGIDRLNQMNAAAMSAMLALAGGGAKKKAPAQTQATPQDMALVWLVVAAGGFAAVKLLKHHH